MLALSFALSFVLFNPLLTAPVASAADSTELTWDLLIDGRKLGERTLTVKELPAAQGTRRVLESTTTLDTSSLGVPYAFTQRLTAHAGELPASFHSVVKDGGRAREIQGRTDGMLWSMSIVEKGRTRSWDLGPTEVDLSTADLIDPGTRAPLARFEKARLLSVETGDVVVGTVKSLGVEDILIAGEKVPAAAWSWTADTGESRFWYTSDGLLLQYQTLLGNNKVEARLQKLPPVGIDEAPVTAGGGGIKEEEI